ncbi:MAG: DUF58 domain-containing protein [Oscillospiraceae bacterium]|nr:DUF58 domain-containing protein [Oscillospiraceae bacterium]
MIGAVLVYALVLVCLAVFYVLYTDSFALIMLVCLLVLPLLLRLWVRLACRRARCSLTSSIQACTQGESIPVTLSVAYPGLLFLPRVQAAVRVQHAFSNTPEVLQLRFPLHGRNTTRLTFHVRAGYCGAVRIRLTGVRGYDPLLLSRARLRTVLPQTDVIILPKPVPVELTRAARPVYAPDSDRYAAQPGDDPSEIYRIREYQPGDPVGRIHWKLTARTGTPYLKELGYPVEACCLLLVQASREGDSGSLQSLEMLMTLAYSLPLALLRAGEPFRLAWFDTDGVLRERTASEEGALALLFREIYESIRTDAVPVHAVREGFTGREFSSAVLLTNDSTCALLPQWEQVLPANERTCVLVTREEAPVSDTVRILTAAPDRAPVINLIV